MRTYHYRTWQSFMVALIGLFFMGLGISTGIESLKSGPGANGNSADTTVFAISFSAALVLLGGIMLSSRVRVFKDTWMFDGKQLTWTNGYDTAHIQPDAITSLKPSYEPGDQEFQFSAQIGRRCYRFDGTFTERAEFYEILKALMDSADQAPD